MRTMRWTRRFELQVAVSGAAAGTGPMMDGQALALRMKWRQCRWQTGTCLADGEKAETSGARKVQGDVARSGRAKGCGMDASGIRWTERVELSS